MDPTLSDIINVLESLAPPALAEDWDNVGLQVGDPGSTIKSIWVALDPTYPVVKAACRQQIDLLVTHHPLIFKPLQSLNYRTFAGSIVNLAVQHHLAIFSAHTNLDSALGGINDILASRLGLCDLKPLAMARTRQRLKMVIHAPRETESQITRVLFQLRSGAGQRIMGRSAVMPVDGIVASQDSGKILHENQMRMEIQVWHDEISPVVKALAEFQPDDRICYDVYPLNALVQETGIGRVGSLESAMDLKTLAQMIKEKLKLRHVKYAGDPALSVKKVAVCSGSGTSLLADFFTSGAQVFVSGDLRYHDARDAEFAGLGLIDIGHFHSEHFIVEALAKRLAGIFADSEMNLTVKACDLEKDPFTVL